MYLQVWGEHRLELAAVVKLHVVVWGGRRRGQELRAGLSKGAEGRARRVGLYVSPEQEGAGR